MSKKQLKKFINEKIVDTTLKYLKDKNEKKIRQIFTVFKKGELLFSSVGPLKIIHVL